jgi:hypothetical protein
MNHELIRVSMSIVLNNQAAISKYQTTLEGAELASLPQSVA